MRDFVAELEASKALPPAAAAALSALTPAAYTGISAAQATGVTAEVNRLLRRS